MFRRNYMRCTLIISLFILLLTDADSQQRLLIAPDQDVTPISPGDNSTDLVRTRIQTSSEKCPTGFGFPEPPCWGIWSLGAKHRDVIGQWYVAPATGTIDTIYWMTGSSVGSLDSLILIRIHKSHIGPLFGPGARPGPYNPPCQMWGYWQNTNDKDMGIAPFIEEATDTTWISTILNSPLPSSPPFGEELWIPGGYPVVGKPNTVQQIIVNDAYPLQVTKGDVFFISFSTNYDPGLALSDPHYPGEEFTTIRGETFCTNTLSSDYPSRVWKFYEHDNGTPYCNGLSIDSVRRGWMARGNFFNSDSLTVGLYRIWYSMTVTENSPPVIMDDGARPVLEGMPAYIDAEIKDCHGFQSPSDGVTQATIEYSVDGIPQPDENMVRADMYHDLWSAVLPARSGDHIVRYRVKAEDLDLAVSYSDYKEFRIIGFGNTWYTLDTSTCTTQKDIHLTGTSIPSSSFFSPSYPGSGQDSKDNGTAGPFEMGGNFMLFGQAFHYAWIGVDGALALTSSATDTMDISANGQYNSAWTIPSVDLHHGRGDSADVLGVPKMFIAPFYTNFTLGQDTASTSLGNIYYGNGGDQCQFIVEWNSLGYHHWDGIYSSNITFRVVLNRCNGTVEFQYGPDWYAGYSSAGLTGMQKDELPFASYVSLNDKGYPREIRPRSNWCYTMTPTAGATVDDGWNLISVAGIPRDGNYAVTHIFPNGTSRAFGLKGPVDTLVNGLGYWMKFVEAHRAGVPGIWQSSLTIPVQDKWNIIGSVSGFVSTGTITPGGAFVVSPFFGYERGYYPVTILNPGHGYWAKIAGAGTLTLNSLSAAAERLSPPAQTYFTEMNSITFTDKLKRSQTLYFGKDNLIEQELSYFELPPPPPDGGFDVRFSTGGRMVETYTETTKQPNVFPIQLQSAKYPITLSWNIHPMESKHIEITAGEQTVSISDQGTTIIHDASTHQLILRVSDGAIPNKFALSQNYPNPFNPITRFRVDVVAALRVEISVFDILGRKIITLLNDDKPPGSFTLEWNGQDSHGLPVPTGMYFIRMTAGDFTDSRKVIFIK